jgi:hypothetical protein
MCCEVLHGSACQSAPLARLRCGCASSLRALLVGRQQGSLEVAPHSSRSSSLGQILTSQQPKMRLINCSTSPLQLEEFFNHNIPPYAILSHTWGNEEVSFAEFTLSPDTAVKRQGYRKIRLTCEQALRDDLNYAWADTCCTIQTHHRRQCPTKRVAYAAENGGRMYIAF